MKRLYLLLPLLVLACSWTTPTPRPPTKARLVANTTQATATEQAGCTVTALETLNLRAAAGTSSAVIAILTHGEVVSILPTSAQDNWIPVHTASGLDGWINSKYCKGK